VQPLRIYYNSRNAPEGCWLIDNGSHHSAKSYHTIEIFSEAMIRTNTDPKAVAEEPSGWLELFGTVLEVTHPDGKRTALIEG
jgi:hypothetical protein